MKTKFLGRRTTWIGVVLVAIALLASTPKARQSVSAGGVFEPLRDYVVAGQWTYTNTTPLVLQGLTGVLYGNGSTAVTAVATSGTGSFIRGGSPTITTPTFPTGGVLFTNATSGTITLSPPTGALGTVTVSLPAATDTLVGKATTDTLTNKTLTAPVLGGSVTGTYTLAGTPTITSPAINGGIFDQIISTTAKILFKGTGTGPAQMAASQTTVPTCSSNCGTSPSVVGTDTAGLVTMGASGSPTSGWVVTFNGTWAAAPVCLAGSALAGMAAGKAPIVQATTTTTLTVTTNGTAPSTSDKYMYMCFGTQ